MTIGDEWNIIRHDEEIQGIFDEWCDLWGSDDLPVLELLGGETLEMYRERLKNEFAERKRVMELEEAQNNNSKNLARFLEAHQKNYDKALKEVKAGYKRSHWMWFIFPQIKGLGKSKTSTFYAISGLKEAQDYLEEPTLKAHMLEICNALLTLDTNDAEDVFDYPDNLKLQSSMTLFAIACPKEPIFQRVLDKFFSGEHDEKTLELI